jgi:hypothetical protein
MPVVDFTPAKVKSTKRRIVPTAVLPLGDAADALNVILRENTSVVATIEAETDA